MEMNGKTSTLDTTPLDACKKNIEDGSTAGVILIEILNDGNVQFRVINPPPGVIFVGALELVKNSVLMQFAGNAQARPTSRLALPPHMAGR